MYICARVRFTNAPVLERRAETGVLEKSFVLSETERQWRIELSTENEKWSWQISRGELHAWKWNIKISSALGLWHLSRRWAMRECGEGVEHTCAAISTNVSLERRKAWNWNDATNFSTDCQTRTSNLWYIIRKCQTYLLFFISKTKLKLPFKSRVKDSLSNPLFCFFMKHSFGCVSVKLGFGCTLYL